MTIAATSSENYHPPVPRRGEGPFPRIMVATSRRAPLKVTLAKPRSAATAVRTAAVTGARRAICGR
jgi:hypothetical protein